jgi:glycine C-acetyltransferase
MSDLWRAARRSLLRLRDKKRIWENVQMTEQDSITGANDSEANHPDAFAKHLGMFIEPEGSHLIERTRALGEWVRQRTELSTWPYARALDQAPGAMTRIKSQNGITVEGYNFGSQDYLGLSQHPAVRDAAMSALREFGPHAAASPMLQGNTTLSRRLEQEIAELVNMDHVLLFPTGWAAGFGAIVGLVRSNDHIVIDQLAHSCLMQGARAATANIRFFHHNDIDDVRKKLRRIRAKDAVNAILVVSEGLFSMDSDSPDIAGLQDACNEYGAVLMVDVAHDLGAQGPGGTGQIGVQKMLGKVDIVMGSFSKTFSSNGGFVAAHDLSVKQFLGIYGGSHTYSNAISPVQCGVVAEALRIVRSAEGDELRARSKANIHKLRGEFALKGIECLGAPSNVVPVTVGDEKLAKWTSHYLEMNGLIANLVEYPAVARNRARFRFQVMASHTEDQIESAIEIFCRSMDAAQKKVSA